MLCDALEAVYVATCDREIAGAVERFGGQAIMTADTHERASDRVAEAAEHIDADVVVMVQGDEPMTTPEMVSLALGPMGDDGVRCVNLMARITDEAEFRDPNTIKLTKDLDDRALMFSREPIPTAVNKGFPEIEAWKQVCIIPFTSDALAEFASLEPTPLEAAESIDMLRFLEHGRPVHLVETAGFSRAVDTPDDLAAVEELMRSDPLAASYA
jgi:3-deoxy-manno-octulosonate cytidylyltransferase (CMP-KDO synthetase)